MQEDSQMEGPSTNGHTTPPIDLVGGPFAVIESDPAVFTSLTGKLGIKGVEVVELYDIEPWATDHLSPKGLIFCFMWNKDSHRPKDFDDAAAEKVWFANQVIDDACASQAILNVLLNCPEVDLGETLRVFRADTEEMSPVMKGLAISNSRTIREAHTSLARPADIFAAKHALVKTTAAAEKKAATKPKPPPARKTRPPAKKPKTEDDEETVDSYHFIGYVPTQGKVWELDGLKSGPLEVGELPDGTSTQGWMDIVRPALKMKMKKYGGDGSDGGTNIRFSLLAIVDSKYAELSDVVELLKREKNALEKRLGELGDGWIQQVDQSLFPSSPTLDGPVYAMDFGSRRMQQDMKIMDLPERRLVDAWNTCMHSMFSAQVALEEENSKSIAAHTEHIKRTHDYDKLFQEYVTCLHEAGLLNALIGLDENGKKLPKAKPKK